MSDSNDQESRDVPGPHQAISTTDARERFACTLFDRLWDRYRKRVTHVAAYEQLVRSVDATFVNDHIAFRTIACQQPATGIASYLDERVFAPYLGACDVLLEIGPGGGP